MKKTTLLAIILIIAFLPILAQVSPVVPKKPAVPVSSGSERLIINYNLNGWIGAPANITQDYHLSRGISLNFFGNKNIVKENFGLGMGLGFSSTNVASNVSISYLVDSDGSTQTIFGNVDSSRTYRINKITTNFIEIPLELRFRTNENKHKQRFRLGLGAKAGVLVHSHDKIRYSDETYMVKTYNLANLRKYRYGIIGRIGYGKYAFSAYYPLTSVFENGKGPDIYTFSVGITVTY